MEQSPEQKSKVNKRVFDGLTAFVVKYANCRSCARGHIFLAPTCLGCHVAQGHNIRQQIEVQIRSTENYSSLYNKRSVECNETDVFYQ